MKAWILAVCLAGGWGPLQAAEKERNAVAKNDQFQWITSDDFPMAALRYELEGAIKIELTVGPDGLVKNCVVLESSGHDVLDRRTCDLVRTRASFHPALDRQGLAVESTVRRAFSWQMPEKGPDVPFGDTMVQWDVITANDGSIERCSMTSAGTVDSSTEDCSDRKWADLPPVLQDIVPKGPVAMSYRHIVAVDHDWIMENSVASGPDWQRLFLLRASSTLGSEGGKLRDCAIKETRGPEKFILPLCEYLARGSYSPFLDENGKPVSIPVEIVTVAFYRSLVD